MLPFLAGLLAVSSSTFQLARAADVNYTLNLANGNIAPDGFTRNAILVNGTFPGPLIFANKDDTLHIQVNNQLSNTDMRVETSIHWHGLFQQRTAYEDGAAFVTQCPIIPGQSYTYSFPLNGQSGTYWYHSHLSTQYVDGLRGPLVIYDPDDPQKSLYDVDDSTTVINIDDWYQTNAVALGQKLFSKDGGDDPVPDSGLINGKGMYSGGPPQNHSILQVTQGKRYRFRIINSSAYGRYDISFNSHPMTIIESDGVLTQPLQVDRLTILPGQRYSVVINATQPVANYWFYTVMHVKNGDHNSHLDGQNIAAILRYDGAPDADPTSAPTNTGALLSENNLKPLLNPGPPGVNDGLPVQTIDIDFDHDDDDHSYHWTINKIAYKSPDLPTLLSILNNVNTFNRSQDVITIQPNSAIELHIHGSDNDHIHPIHLHGHTFDVIQSNDGGGANYVDPPRRDVTGFSNDITIRFRTDNPGPWFLHCHIEWHLEAGMALVFAESPDQQRSGNQSVTPDQDWQNLCPTYQAWTPPQSSLESPSSPQKGSGAASFTAASSTVLGGLVLLFLTLSL